MQTFLDGKVTLLPGDCREVLATLPENSVDAIVCDPPYALTGASRNGSPRNNDPESPFGRTKLGERGFMGKTWDTGETAFAVEFWQQALRVLKPGGHCVAFSGTRTYHRMACAIEDAGFEIRDQLAWAYGTGFNKVGYIRNRDGEIVRDGWAGALKPAWEPICLARKPLIGTVAANILAHGTGALNVDGCRVGPVVDTRRSKGNNPAASSAFPHSDDAWTPRLAEAGHVGARWPANLLHDGSDEVLACFPDSAGQQGDVSGDEPSNITNAIYGQFKGRPATQARNDSGSAARFFYTSKADSSDRIGSKHPTVKPVDLMQWLCRLVTPKGGVVLDPFAGTGTTGEAAWREGMRAILIEREAEYQEDIARRMDLILKPTKRAAVAKSKNNLDKPEDLPLFGGTT